jgi:hypothetical protein
MAIYACAFRETLSTTDDLRTLQTVATGQGSVLKVIEVSLSGESSSSAVTQFAVNRPSGAPTGAATNVTPEKIDPASVAAAFTNASTYATTQPTLSTNDVLNPSLNTFGGIYRWVAYPGSEIVVGGQGAVAYLSFRARSGATPVSGHIIVEER